MMKNKLVGLLVSITTIFLLASCSSNEQNVNVDELNATITELEGKLAQANQKILGLEGQVVTLQENVKTKEDKVNELEEALENANKQIDELTSVYTIKIVDLDGKNLGEKKLKVDSYTNLFDALQNEFTLDGGMGDYGAFINSINGSIVDSAWSMMIFQNNEESMNSAEKIVPKKGDTFEIRNTCWKAIDYGFGTEYDEVDVMLDIAIYKYIKTYLKEAVEAIKTYTGSTYWEMLFIDAYKRAGYDTSLMNFKYTEDLKKSIINADVTTLKNANIGKYYSHALNLGIISKDFKASYQTTLDNLQTTFNSYTTPFVLFPAAYEKMTSTAVQTLATADITGSTQFGPDGNIWQLTSQALFADRSNAIDILPTYVKDYSNNTSNAILLQGFAAINEDIRNTEKYGKITFEEKEYDYLEFLFKKYYDNELGLMKVYTKDTKVNQSTNQVYCGLLAYKAFRDSNNKFNIFGPFIESK